MQVVVDSTVHDAAWSSRAGHDITPVSIVTMYLGSDVIDNNRLLLLLLTFCCCVAMVTGSEADVDVGSWPSLLGTSRVGGDQAIVSRDQVPARMMRLYRRLLAGKLSNAATFRTYFSHGLSYRFHLAVAGDQWASVCFEKSGNNLNICCYDNTGLVFAATVLCVVKHTIL